MRYWNLFFLLLNQNICGEYSKEPSQRHISKYIFEMMGKKIITILCSWTTLHTRVAVAFKAKQDIEEVYS